MEMILSWWWFSLVVLCFSYRVFTVCPARSRRASTYLSKCGAGCVVLQWKTEEKKNILYTLQTCWVCCLVVVVVLVVAIVVVCCCCCCSFSSSSSTSSRSCCCCSCSSCCWWRQSCFVQNKLKDFNWKTTPGTARHSTARRDCNCNYNPEWSAQWHLKWSVCRPIRTLVLAAQLNCRGEGSTNRSRVADWGGGANPSRPSRRTNHQNRHAEWTHHHAMRACRLG